MIQCKRIYLAAEPADGTRVLVERLWPRGVTKDAASIDLWLKEIAPSTALRQWFGHAPDRWSEFQARYRQELEANTEAVQRLRDIAAEGDLTLLYSARDVPGNSALVLLDYLSGSRR